MTTLTAKIASAFAVRADLSPPFQSEIAEPSQSAPVAKSVTRRVLMNSIVALPIVAALPVAAPAMTSTSTTDRRALEAYASWLFMERRILCGELWPRMGTKAERHVSLQNAGADWHFRGDGDWRDLPQPSTRAAAVLDLVGIDWRQDREVSYEDTGERPQLPAGWPGIDSDLVHAAHDIQAIDDALDDLHRRYGDDADSREDYLTLADRRLENITTLIGTPARSMVGVRRGKTAQHNRRLLRHRQLADSLADDLTSEARSPVPAERPHPDAELLSLAAKYVATEAEQSRLCKLANELEDAFLDEGKPEALRVRPGDAELGIHAFFGRLGEDHNYFNIDVLRWPKWPHPDSKVEIEMGRIVAERLFEPSAEARARADEIIAANDQFWQKTKGKKKPRRLVAIQRKRRQLETYERSRRADHQDAGDHDRGHGGESAMRESL
jgi:hypothetical protein